MPTRSTPGLRPGGAGIALLGIGVLTFGLLTACGPSTPTDAGSRGSSPTADSAGGDDSAAGESGHAGDAAFPREVDNCGFDVTVASPPQRIVTIKSTSTEMVLALGLGERIVATAFSDGPLPAELSFPGQAPPVLSDKAPSAEAVLAVEPDFVFAGWESNLTAETAGERADLADLGVSTYVAPPACQEADYQPDPLTFEHIFDFIAETGTLLGAPDQARELIAAQRDELATITPSSAGMTALWYSSGSDIPFVGGGIGAPQLLMDTAGLRNINADVDQTWASVSWEAIADQDPDVIVLVDSEWNSAAHKIDVLTANPMTAAMTAVQESRYLTIPFPASEAGVRSVGAAAALAEQAAQLEDAS